MCDVHIGQTGLFVSTAAYWQQQMTNPNNSFQQGWTSLLVWPNRVGVNQQDWECDQ